MGGLMPKGFVTMSTKEIDRGELIRRVREKRLTQPKAAAMLGLSVRQVKRLCQRFKADGLSGLASRQRGRPSNRKLAAKMKSEVVALVRERYADFGPKLAHEKLVEVHDIRVGRETLRGWLTEAGIWLPRAARTLRAHQPRHRRQCFGELVQIDGCDHEWFESRADRCTALVYVDDATSKLMELRFVVSESAFDYFAATESYLSRHGKPVAFYSDKHSIFRVTQEGASGRSGGVTQFGRALATLNIDIICANTPQAKGRVERMNKTLQDRLVKEMRLRGISSMAAANAYAPEFMADYNRRFAREPMNAHDAHRPLQPDEDLAHIFTWQEERRMTRNLVVHFRRLTYLIVPTSETLALAGRRVLIHERADGQVEIHCAGRCLPYSVLDKQPLVAPGEVIENKRLGAVLSLIQAGQEERDKRRLSSKKLTLRQKERLRETRAKAGRLPQAPLASSPPAPGSDRLAQALAATQEGAGCASAVTDFLANFAAEQKARRKKYNDVSNRRKRERELLALQTQAELNRQVVRGGGEDPQPIVYGSASLRAVEARCSAGSAPAAQD
jgi:transposase